MLYYKPVQVPFIEVVLLNKEPFHILDFLRNEARLTLEDEDGVLVEPNEPIFLELFLFIDLHAIVLNPGGIADEFRDAVGILHLPDIVVETFEVGGEDLFMSFNELAELLNVETVFIDVQLLFLKQKGGIATYQH